MTPDRFELTTNPNTGTYQEPGSSFAYQERRFVDTETGAEMFVRVYAYNHDLPPAMDWVMTRLGEPL